ncbi:MAG TPA: hypothetical protein VFR70_00975 [Flavobacterium sp.]|nr:hypothetical protein [Flavobacterium sp.]
MKKIMIFISVILIIGCNSKSSENYESLLKIKKGMSHDSVNSIMKNKPREIKTAFWNDTLFVNYYDSGFGASDDFKIVFNKKDSTVVDVEYGD